jgi:hypothetical protein
MDQSPAVRLRKSKCIRIYKMYEEDRKKYKTLKEFAIVESGVKHHKTIKKIVEILNNLSKGH